MKKIDIIVGSVLGATEYVADAIEAKCQSLGLAVNVHFKPDFAEIDPTSTWIVCTSTHGAGDLPDNIQPFYAQLMQHSLHNDCLVVGLGDSSYDTYCQGAQTLYKALVQAGVTPINEVFLVDVLHHPIPENTVMDWITPHLEAMCT